MTPVNVILMETEGPGFDSQKRHPALVAIEQLIALVAQLVEHRSYTIRIHM